jgi:hypothetical protein
VSTEAIRRRNEMASKTEAVFEFHPVGVDLWDRRSHQPEPGARVVKTQPYGCPRNGTMGHCYVKDAETGVFHGLVLLSSLVAAGRQKVAS